MTRKKYTITIDDRAGAGIAEVAERLREAGFEIAQRLDAIGVIVGRADATLLPRLRRLPGVAAIEEERAIDILPSAHDASGGDE